MQELSGQCNGPVILLHGGATSEDPKGKRLAEARREMAKIIKVAWRDLQRGISAVNIVSLCLAALEDSELFNAGSGAALQGDGQARLTAAIMDGRGQKFSGVVGSTYIQNPSRLALHLQKSRSRVLGPPGCELLARGLSLPVSNPQTERRVRRWFELSLSHGGRKKEKSQSTSFDADQWDTVGCVVRDKSMTLASGTSTGGRGFEFPGRMSDSGTVAGNYATQFAAISCTGIGEEIVDDALAARIETRCRDGKTLAQATHLCFAEARRLKRSYGWIAINGEGEWNISFTTNAMAYMGMANGKILTI